MRAYWKAHRGLSGQYQSMPRKDKQETGPSVFSLDKGTPKKKCAKKQEKFELESKQGSKKKILR